LFGKVAEFGVSIKVKLMNIIAAFLDEKVY